MNQTAKEMMCEEFARQAIRAFEAATDLSVIFLALADKAYEAGYSAGCDYSALVRAESHAKSM